MKKQPSCEGTAAAARGTRVALRSAQEAAGATETSAASRAGEAAASCSAATRGGPERERKDPEEDTGREGGIGARQRKQTAGPETGTAGKGEEGRENSEEHGVEKEGQREKKQKGAAVTATEGKQQDIEEDEDPVEYEELVYITFPELALSSIFTPAPAAEAVAAATVRCSEAAAAAGAADSLADSPATTEVATPAAAAVAGRGGDRAGEALAAPAALENAAGAAGGVATAADLIEQAVRRVWQSQRERTAFSAASAEEAFSLERQQLPHQPPRGEGGGGGEGAAAALARHRTAKGSNEAAAAPEEGDREPAGRATAAAAPASGCRIQLFDLNSEKPLALINGSLPFVGRSSRSDALETLLLLRCGLEQQQQAAELMPQQRERHTQPQIGSIRTAKRRRRLGGNAVDAEPGGAEALAEGLATHTVEFVVDAGAAAAVRAAATLQQEATR